MLTFDLWLGLDGMALLLSLQPRAALAGVFSQLPWQALPFSKESGLIPLTPCQLLILHGQDSHSAWDSYIT